LSRSLTTAGWVPKNPPPVKICPRRLCDPPVLVSDSTKARELLGWSPKFPELDEQIAHAWAWFRDKTSEVVDAIG
jgi:UDP-glucose 4-epimerase